MCYSDVMIVVVGVLMIMMPMTERIWQSFIIVIIHPSHGYKTGGLTPRDNNKQNKPFPLWAKKGSTGKYGANYLPTHYYYLL